MQRKLLRPHVVAALSQAFAAAKTDLRELHFQHCRDLRDLHQEIRELRCIISDVVTALRMKADSDVARLRRELERALLRLAPDPGKPLN